MDENRAEGDTMQVSAEEALAAGGRAPEGTHLEWYPDSDWVARPKSLGRCRYMEGRKSCGAPAVASMNRKRHMRDGRVLPNWHDYCGVHLYGRKIIDGIVCSMRLVDDG